MSENCALKVTSLGLKAQLQKNESKSINSAPLIKFVPKKSDKSEILNDYKISNLIEHFPPMYRAKDWELLFTLNRDGVSLGTFYDRCKTWTITLLVVQDSNGWVFGGFCNETWR
jgi:TLD